MTKGLRVASRRKHSVIGVDLGDTSVKMVQLRAAGDGKWRLQAVAKGRCNVPVDDEDHAERSNVVAAKMKRLLKEGAFEGRLAATVLPRSDVFLRPVKLSGKLDPADNEGIWEALKAEARRYLPYPPEEAVLDFVAIGKVRDEDGEQLEALLISAPQTIVDRHMSMLRAAGLDCAFIDIVPNAMLRSVQHAVAGNGQDAVASIEIGNVTTSISISRADRLLFARNVSIGGHTFTESVAAKLQLSGRKAEQFKRRYGMNHRGVSNLDCRVLLDAKFGSDEAAALIFELCQEPLRTLAREIRRSLDYFATQFRGIVVSKAFLFGGGASFTGLSEFLTDNTGLAVQTGEPFAAVQTDSTDAGTGVPDDGTSYAVALGLALREE